MLTALAGLWQRPTQLDLAGSRTLKGAPCCVCSKPPSLNTFPEPNNERRKGHLAACRSPTLAYNSSVGEEHRQWPICRRHGVKQGPKVVVLLVLRLRLTKDKNKGVSRTIAKGSGIPGSGGGAAGRGAPLPANPFVGRIFRVSTDIKHRHKVSRPGNCPRALPPIAVDETEPAMNFQVNTSPSGRPARGQVRHQVGRIPRNRLMVGELEHQRRRCASEKKPAMPTIPRLRAVATLHLTILTRKHGAAKGFELAVLSRPQVLLDGRVGLGGWDPRSPSKALHGRATVLVAEGNTQGGRGWEAIGTAAPRMKGGTMS